MQVFGPTLGADPVGHARSLEDAGFDGVRVIDHFFCPWPGGPAEWFPHSIATLAAAAVATTRAQLTQTVMSAAFRHPAEVAQAIATIDRLSGGRAGLGLGAGWYDPEFDAFGLRLGPPAE